VFAEQRDWTRFHTPKNLALALAGEVGELAAELQWLTTEEASSLDDHGTARLADEIADVLIYLVRLSDVTGIDLVEAAHHKVSRNDGRTWSDTARNPA
jgi:NTP pyrophosphatase (non-canonical NTP hydrolase)